MKKLKFKVQTFDLNSIEAVEIDSETEKTIVLSEYKNKVCKYSSSNIYFNTFDDANYYIIQQLSEQQRQLTIKRDKVNRLIYKWKDSKKIGVYK